MDAWPTSTMVRPGGGLSLKQVQVMKTRRKIWARSRLPFFFPSPYQAEQDGRCRRGGGTRPPENAHTTAKVAPIVKGKGKPIQGVCCMGHPPVTPALSQAPSRYDASPAPLPLALEASGSTTAMRTAEEMADPGQKPRSRRMAGLESWLGGNIGMEETACTLWEKIWGVWTRASSLLHPPLKGLKLLLISCHRRKGKEREEHLPHHPHRHTDTLTHPSSRKASPPIGQHHIQGQTTTPQPHHDPPCLSSEQQGHPGMVGAPLPPH